MGWFQRFLTLVYRVSIRIAGLFLLLFVVNLFLNLKFQNNVPPSDVQTKPEQKIYIKATQNVYVESRPASTASNTLKSDKFKVMIMSSMPRSGSTLMGELLSNYSKGTKYYFEPDQYLEKTSCLENDKCTIEFFNDILSCKGNAAFYDWFKNKKFFFQFYNERALKCSNEAPSYKSCVDGINLIDDCLNSDLQLIKNIRTRLKIVRNLLETNKYLKILHLFRDPRGALWSIQRFKWNVSEQTRCQNFLEDLNSYSVLKNEFPNRIMNVSYELFSKKPYEETKRIFKFLFDLNDIPEMTKHFLKEHLSPEAEKIEVMSTVRNATNQYQKWRHKITNKYLKKIEGNSDCREGILRMKHNLFKKVSKAKDENISLFAN